MSDIIVSAIAQAECASLAEPGHGWVVEGDFGFLGSYATKAQALAAAEVDAAASGSTVLLNE